MFKKILLFIYILVFIMLTPVNIIREDQVSFNSTTAFKEMDANEWAVANGSFIQWWMVKDWNDAEWEDEYRILKEAGMDYVVLAPTAFYTSGKKTETIYPTRLEWAETMRDDNGRKYGDVVGSCLRNAQKLGIKVFLGLNFSDEWWTERRDAGWMYARMREGNEIAGELWERYHDKYPDAFYGWYWCWEVDNGYFRVFDLSGSKKVLADAIRIQTDYLDAKGRHLPFMLAPFMDWRLSTPLGYAKMWEYVFANSGLREGDIFSPQDCIGGGGLNTGNYVKWFAELRKAVDTKPGLQLWVDTETFDVSDWTAVTLDLFVKKMQELKPYVDNFITFAYSHYYSPGVVSAGFHKTYLKYVRSGKLEDIPPDRPTNLKASLGEGGSICLDWTDAEDNIGICGYYVYRNGKKIANRQVRRFDTGNESISDFEDNVPITGEEYIYEVQAYDFAGNVSAKSESVHVFVD